MIGDESDAIRDARARVARAEAELVDAKRNVRAAKAKQAAAAAAVDETSAALSRFYRENFEALIAPFFDNANPNTGEPQ